MCLALVLVTLMVFNTVACSRSELAQAAQKSNAVVQFLSGVDIPAQLAAAGVKYTEDEARELSQKVSAFSNSYAAFNTRFQQGIKSGASLAELSGGFVDELVEFNNIFQFKFNDPATQRTLQKILASVRIGIDVVAALFASQLLKARAVFQENYNDYYLRLGFALNRAPYDGKRLRLLKSQMPDKSASSADRALCEYFKLNYESEKIALLEQYARG
jgi:hypothetical protein